PAGGGPDGAALQTATAKKKLGPLGAWGSGAAGTAAPRLEAFVISEAAYAYGGYPDIDAMFREQAGELDRKKREAILFRIQQLMHDRVMVMPLTEPAFLNGVGARVAEAGLGLIDNYPYSAPYADLKLQGS